MNDAVNIRHNSSVPDAYSPFLARHPVSRALADDVFAITGYREAGVALEGSVEAAPLVVPMIISFAQPFEIALGRDPSAGDRYGSFVSGLYPGFVRISSTGAAECIQIDFTPLGAYRFLGLPMHEISNRMVHLEDLGDPSLAELRDRLGETADWPARFALVETYLTTRLARGRGGSAAVSWAYRHILEFAGQARIGNIAARLEWSRKHLNSRFRQEIGIGPKTVARMARFNRALSASRRPGACDWSQIAAECGYADQAHLVREFCEFAGMSPSMFAARNGR